jgi:hypothetical protein
MESLTMELENNKVALGTCEAAKTQVEAMFKRLNFLLCFRFCFHFPRLS